MIPDVKDLPCTERLKRLNLITLETRRLRYYLEIIKGSDKIEFSHFLQLDNSDSRGHQNKLLKKCPNLTIVFILKQSS